MGTQEVTIVVHEVIKYIVDDDCSASVCRQKPHKLLVPDSFLPLSDPELARVCKYLGLESCREGLEISVPD
jgi:hypothetical protein